WYQQTQLAAEGETGIAIRLQRGATVAGRVTDEAGRPLAAWVESRSTAWFDAGIDFDDFHGPDWALTWAMASADGRYRLAALTPSAIRLQASVDGRQTRGEVHAGEGESVSWDPVLAELAVAGRVVDERGAPLGGWNVTCHPPRGKGSLCGTSTD